MDKCPKCGSEVQGDAVFCDQCGTRLVAAEAPAAAQEPSQGAQGIVCPGCGATNTPGEMFCDNCGAPLAAPQPEPEAVAAAQAEPAPAAPTASGPGAPKTCPDCGATVAEDDEFCYACGADLKASRAVAEPTAVEEQPAAAPSPVPELAAAAPPPAAAPPAALPEPEVAPRECPSCGAKVGPADTFCEFCGAALVTAAEPVPAAQPATLPAPVAAPAPPTVEVGPRLIITASGVEIPLPVGKEALVGRDDPYSGIYPEVDLTPHGGEEAGVSRRHFKLTPAGSPGSPGSQYTIEDLNSTNFTVVNRQRLSPGAPVAINDGDEIRAGSLKLIFKVS